MSSSEIIGHKAAPWVNYDVFKKNKFDNMFLHPRSNVGFRKLVEDSSFVKDFVDAFNEYFSASLPTSFVETIVAKQMPLAVCSTYDKRNLVIDFREEFSWDLPIFNNRLGSAIIINTSMDFESDDELTIAVGTRNGLRFESSSDDRMQFYFVNKDKLAHKHLLFYKILDAICNPGDLLAANLAEPKLKYYKDNLCISKCFKQMVKEQQLELQKNEQQFAEMLTVGEFYKFI